MAGTTKEIGGATTEVTLTDDDNPTVAPPNDPSDPPSDTPSAPRVLAPISLTADPSSVAEGGGSRTVTVTATVGNGKAYPDAKTVTVTVGAGGDGAQSGTDYAGVSAFTITIKAEQNSGSSTFTLAPIDDRVIEGNEGISVSGTTTDVAVSGTGVTLVDDDYTEITLTASPASVDEGAGATTVTVTAETDGDVFKYGRTVTVSVGAGGDGAESGTDYDTVSDFTIRIAAGHTSGSETFDARRRWTTG